MPARQTRRRFLAARLAAALALLPAVGLLTAAAPANTDQARIETRNADSTKLEKRSLREVMVSLLYSVVTDVETLELDL